MDSFIQCVSIPRSGHHLLIRLLRPYYQGGDRRNPSFYYCGHYQSCKTHPCTCREKGIRRFVQDHPEPQLTFQKSHDRRMPYPRSDEEKFWDEDTDEPELTVDTEHRTIVQIRRPIMSIISDYRLSCGAFTTAERWRTFAEIGMLYRKAFLEKWILGNEYIGEDSYHVVQYEDLLADPEAQLARTIAWASPGRPLDADAIARVLEQRPVSARWSLDDFVFRDTVSELEQPIADVWARALDVTRKLTATP